MKALSLREIQEESLKILREVHLFCESTGIHYSLAYGTLIGAIRHKGFIPWDDDIDIFMPRPDYERFCSLYQSNNYQLICKEKDNTCMMAFAKVCDMSKTRATVSPWTKQKVGVGIDVFPLDGAEEEFDLFSARYGRIKQLWMKLFVHRALQNGIREENSKKLNLMIKILDSTGLSVINRQLARRKVNRIESIAKSVRFEDANHCTMMVFCDDGTNSYYQKKDFESLIPVPFEGYEFFAYSGYDGILRAVYGDYMKMPPLEKRVPSHDNKYYWL